MTLHNISRYLILFFTLSIVLLETEAKDSIMAPKAQESLLLDLVELDSGRLIAVGERGHILLSDDQGATWQQKSTPTRDTLTAVDFFDEQNGVAVGYEQTILLTNDGGESWQLKHQLENAVDSPAFFDVEYVNKNRIVAIGAYGLYFESDDGGEAWTGREVNALADFYDGFSHFYGITQLDNSDTLFLAGEKYVANEDQDGVETNTGLLAVSRDAGKTWDKLSSPYSGSFFGIQVSPDKQLYAYGLKGNLYRSSDQGANWQQVALNTTSGLHDIAFDDQNQWYAVGTSGTLIDGKDLSLNKRSDLRGRAAVVVLDDGRLLIVGEGGVEILDTASSENAEAQ